MLDLKLIREHTDLVREGVRKKGEDPASVDEVLRLDEHRRALIQETEGLKSRKNTVSQTVARMKSKGEDAQAVIDEMRSVADRIKVLDEELKSEEGRLRSVLLAIPNIPHESVPAGKSPADNQVIASWGEPPVIDFPPKPHWELLEKLRIIDFPRGTKVTGAGFPFFVGKGARLERALINFFPSQPPRYPSQIFTATKSSPKTCSRSISAPLPPVFGGKRVHTARMSGASTASISSTRWNWSNWCVRSIPMKSWKPSAGMPNSRFRNSDCTIMCC